MIIHRAKLAMDIMIWAKDNQFPYSLNLSKCDPLNEKYVLEFSQQEHEFLAKITWGLIK